VVSTCTSTCGDGVSCGSDEDINVFQITADAVHYFEIVPVPDGLYDEATVSEYIFHKP